MECPVEVQEITTKPEVPVVFDSVVAMDNLGEPLITYATSEQGAPVNDSFPADGISRGIIATAKDSFNNAASCNFTLTVVRKGILALSTIG